MLFFLKGDEPDATKNVPAEQTRDEGCEDDWEAKGFDGDKEPKGGGQEDRRRRQTELLEWSVCLGDTHFLETDDCLEMVSRETTDGEGMKSRAADWPGEDCQASESNADLRHDQTPASPGT